MKTQYLLEKHATGDCMSLEDSDLFEYGGRLFIRIKVGAEAGRNVIEY